MKVLVGSFLAALSLSGAALADDVLAHHDDGTWIRGSAQTGPWQMSSPQFTPRGATLLYDASTQTGFRANAGSAGFTTGAPADANRMLLDDVPIPNSSLSGATSIDG